MTSNNDEDRLRELFERSAEVPDKLALERLGARARDVVSARSSRRIWRYVAVSVAAAACLALGVSALMPARSTNGSERIAATSVEPALGESLAVAVSRNESGADEALGSSELGDVGEENVLDDLALDPGDFSETDSETWLSAANDEAG